MGGCAFGFGMHRVEPPWRVCLLWIEAEPNFMLVKVAAILRSFPAVSACCQDEIDLGHMSPV